MAHHTPSELPAAASASQGPRSSASAPDSTSLPGQADLVEVAQLWGALRASYLFILFVAVAVGCTVMLLTLVSGMTFRASSRLYLGEINGKAAGPGSASSDLMLAGGAQSEVASEIEILRSSSLVTRAALESGLNVTLTREGEKPPRYLSWLLARRDLKLIDDVLEELKVENANFFDNTAREAKRFSVRFRTATEYELFSQNESVAHGKLAEPLKTAALSLTLLPGTERKPAPGARYDLVVRPVRAVVDGALAVLEVTAPKQSASGELTNVLTLEFRDGSPHRAAAFLDALMRAYLAERQSWKTEDATAAEAFVSEQLSRMKGSLDQLQQKLADYKSSNDVVVLGKEADSLVEQVGKYEEQRLAARLQVASLSDAKRVLAGPEPPLGAFLIGEADDTVLAGMAQTLSESRAKLADLEARFNDVAPEVRQQRERVNAQLAAVRSYVSSRLSRAQDHLRSLSAIIQQHQEKLKTVPGAEFGLEQLSRESEVYSKTYSYLVERKQQAAISKASTLSKNRVLDPPQVPLREDSPKLMVRLASLVVGLFLGAAIVVIRSLSSGKFQTEGAARRGSCGIPILGTVPLYRDQSNKVRKLEPSTIFTALTRQSHSAFGEATRILRASLRHWGTNNGGVLMVTSPLSGDGKTMLVLSLGAALAAEGKRVLVLDADMTRVVVAPSSKDEPVMRRTLPAVLSGECAWRDAVRGVSHLLPNLRVIDAGRSAASEPLSHEQRTRLLNAARDHFDFVLIDAPSFPTASDALSWVDLADLVISVVRVQHTPRKLATSHLSRLSAFARALAIVINEAGPATRERATYPAIANPTTGNGKDHAPDERRSSWPGVDDALQHPDPQLVVHSRLEVLDGANRGTNKPLPGPVELSPKRSKG